MIAFPTCLRRYKDCVVLAVREDRAEEEQWLLRTRFGGAAPYLRYKEVVRRTVENAGNDDAAGVNEDTCGESAEEGKATTQSKSSADVMDKTGQA